MREGREVAYLRCSSSSCSFLCLLGTSVSLFVLRCADWEIEDVLGPALVAGFSLVAGFRLVDTSVATIRAVGAGIGAVGAAIDAVGAAIDAVGAAIDAGVAMSPRLRSYESSIPCPRAR